MALKNEIIEIIFNSIEETNQENGTEITKDIDTRLFGRECNIDSFGLVNLIVNIEENINNQYNTSIIIADEKAMSQKHSPFRTVDTLADYVIELLIEKL